MLGEDIGLDEHYRRLAFSQKVPLRPGCLTALFPLRVNRYRNGMSALPPLSPC